MHFPNETPDLSHNNTPSGNTPTLTTVTHANHSQPPSISSTASTYSVISTIGEGGWGCVYKAIQESTQRTVAIKVLKSRLSQNPDIRSRFLREARAASMIQDERVVTIYDLGFTTDNEPFIVMEIIEGETLASIIKDRGPMTPQACIRILRQLCLALQAVHSAGVVHRDVKPRNIVLHGPNLSKLKILDFGVAMLTNGTQSITAAGKIFGTPEYMSPELVRGKPIDQRADLYSAGIVAYEMLTGHLPFSYPEPLSVAMAHVSEVPPPIDSPFRVPAQLDRLIFRLLSKEPNDRPETARAVETMLASLSVDINTRGHRARHSRKDLGKSPTRTTAWVVGLLSLVATGLSFESAYWNSTAARLENKTVPTLSSPATPPKPPTSVHHSRRPAEGPLRIVMPAKPGSETQSASPSNIHKALTPSWPLAHDGLEAPQETPPAPPAPPTAVTPQTTDSAEIQSPSV